MANENLDITSRVKRLRKLQIPVLLFLGLNFMLIAAVPFTELYARMTSEVANADEPKVDVSDKPKDDNPTDNDMNNDKPDPKSKVKDPDSDAGKVEPKAKTKTDTPPKANQIPDVSKNDLAIIFGPNSKKDGEPTKSDQNDPGAETNATSPTSSPTFELDPLIENAGRSAIRQGTKFWMQNHAASTANTLFVAQRGLTNGAAFIGKLHRESLVLRNPADWGIAIFYAVDGDVRTIEPGEEHDLGDAGERLIEFHRGGKFGETQYTLTEGRFQFTVASEGWELVRSPSDTENIADEQTP